MRGGPAGCHLYGLDWFESDSLHLDQGLGLKHCYRKKIRLIPSKLASPRGEVETISRRQDFHRFFLSHDAA